MPREDFICPDCGDFCSRDEVDIGVGIMTGPWGCYCGWSEYADAGKIIDGRYIDQWGGSNYLYDSLEELIEDRHL